MPEHILHHSLMVREVAMSIGHSLAEQGHQLNLDLVSVAAVLHDICKIDQINSGEDHARLGAELLNAHGYPEVGAIIGEHVKLKDFRVNESLVIYYADKRVMHDRVVSLDRRFEDLLERYGIDEMRTSRISKLHIKAREAEDLLIEAGRFDRDALNELGLVAADNPFDGGAGVG